MFDRFTDRARKVLGFSRLEAQRLNHDYIGVEHVLLGLVLEDSGVAADVLSKLGVDRGRVRQEVERLVTCGTTMVTMGQLPFTPRARRMLELALEEASGLGHNHIGTEHLLLGLIREAEGIAARVLRGLSVGLDDVREEILETLGQAATPETIPALEDKERTTPRVRSAIHHAWRAAERFRHQQIGTEHLLLGIIEEAAGSGSELPRVLLRRLRREVERHLAPGPEPVTEYPLPLSEGAKRVIESAFREARDLHGRVGIAHLLAGLMGEEVGIAARVLSDSGIGLKDVLAEAFGRAPHDERPPSSVRPGFDRVRSRKAMSLAREEAQRFRHDLIDTEHALLGLLLAGGEAVDLLKRLGIDPDRVRRETEARMASGNTAVTSGQLPFTPAMKRVLEIALEEVSVRNEGEVSEAHLLLGLVGEEKGVAAQVLAAAGVTPEAVRRAISGPRRPPG